MNIILNERAFAESVIDKPSDVQLSYNIVYRVARYYMDIMQRLPDAVRKTEEFILRCDGTANLVFWNTFIESSAKTLRTRPLIEIDSVGVTQTELEKIMELRSREARMVLFTMLCFAKFWNIVNKKNNNWINRNYKELFSTANVARSDDMKAAIMRSIFQSGLGGYSMRATSENTYVTFVDNDASPVLEITDFRNLGYQYCAAAGDACIVCEVCGITVPKKANNQKYCRQCAKLQDLEMHKINYHKLTLS